MEFGIFEIFCGAVVGFVTGGLIMSLFRLVTGRPLGFALEDQLGTSPLAILAILVRLIAGPTILARNVVNPDENSEPEPALALAGLAVAVVWSIGVGLPLFVSMMPAFAAP
ncbi:MAG: hypothetical protein R3D33_03895 [Hyphomicrobiaceae bacterium]